MKSRIVKKEENLNLEITNFVFLCPRCRHVNPKIISLNINNCDLSNTIPSIRNKIDEPQITIKCECSEAESTFPLYTFIKKIITPSKKRFIFCDNTTRYHEEKKYGRLYCVFCKKWLCDDCLKSHDEDEEDNVSYHLFLNFQDENMEESMKQQLNDLPKKEKKNRKAEIEQLLKEKKQFENPSKSIKELFFSLKAIHEDMEQFLIKKLKYNNNNYQEEEKEITDNFFEVNEVNTYLYFLYSMAAYNFECNKIYWRNKDVIENFFDILYNYRFYSYSQTVKNNDKIINCLEIRKTNKNYIRPTVEKRFIKWLNIKFEQKKFETLPKGKMNLPAE